MSIRYYCDACDADVTARNYARGSGVTHTFPNGLEVSIEFTVSTDAGGTGRLTTHNGHLCQLCLNTVLAEGEEANP